MFNEREQIAENILALLSGSSVPLKARELTDALHNIGVTVKRTTVNSVLYSELSNRGEVLQDSEYRWSANGRHDKTVSDVHKPESLEQNVWDTPRCVVTSIPEKSRAARRVIQVLRSGTTSCRAAKAISVGTTRIEQRLFARIESLVQTGAKGEMALIVADWGLGKSHMGMLLSGHLSQQSIPFVHECVDARGASLSHIHRSVPRWLENVQFKQTLGLRNALNNGSLSRDRALKWALSNDSRFADGLHAALRGWEWGWVQALGHLYRSPDYSYQHQKAWALVESVATFLNNMNLGGLVLLLDEAENICNEYDIRGRRKSYTTLARMMQHSNILPVMFVTDRLLYKVGEDYEQGARDDWRNWGDDPRWFVERFLELQPIRPPQFTDRLAEDLVKSIEAFYPR